MSRGSRARRLHHLRSIARSTERGARNMAAIEILRNIVEARANRARNRGKRLPTGVELACSVAERSRVPMAEREICALARQLDALTRPRSPCPQGGTCATMVAEED